MNWGIDYLKDLVGQYGLFGFFILITAMNVIIQPVSPDFIIAGSPVLLENSITSIIVVSAFAGICSGLISYFLGKQIGLNGFENLFGKKNMEKGITLYDKYGIWAVVLSAITPIPFSLVCWMAGIFRMKFLPFFFAVLFTRVPRHIIVAYYSEELVKFFS